jgi:hypothetical protein
MYWSFARLSAVTRNYKPRAKIIRAVAQSRSILSFKNQNENMYGIRIKGREMALVWHEKASRTALQTSSLLHMHTLLVQAHNMKPVKEIAEQCRQL